MLRVADVVRRHGPSYLDRYRGSMLPGHVRALEDIPLCRTPEMGGHLATCTQCDRTHLLYHSCRNRTCPQCGFDATSRWLRRQEELLLPVPYSHLVFTLPAELRRLVRTHQKVLLSVLFRAAFNSLQRLCANPRLVGGRIGALAVLHTWTRTLEWHPHVHMLVPGGGLDPDGRTWRSVPRRKSMFLVPVVPLAKLFRARFLHLARRALPTVPFPHVPWSKRWVVFAKPVARGASEVLAYLGRYVHRTAMSDKAILSVEPAVTFRYRPSGEPTSRTMTLPPHEFLRRFLQHTPPKGFHRVRAFGLLHPEHRSELRRLQLLLAPPVDTSGPPVPDRRRATCAHCSAPLRFLRRLDVIECREALAAGHPITIAYPPRGPPP
ncbi:MAG: transposase, partial [Myxococcales bacterium]|nr:transposase [Myxococcales bacterium]